MNILYWLTWIHTSDTVLWNSPSNSYDVHPSQHFFVSHVMFGVTQWKFGVPFANASNVNWVVIGKINTKPMKTSQSIWYLPKEATCPKISSNSNECFSSFDVSFSLSFSAIIPLLEFKTKKQNQWRSVSYYYFLTSESCFPLFRILFRLAWGEVDVTLIPGTSREGSQTK